MEHLVGDLMVVVPLLIGAACWGEAFDRFVNPRQPLPVPLREPPRNRRVVR